MPPKKKINIDYVSKLLEAGFTKESLRNQIKKWIVTFRTTGGNVDI